MPRSTTASRKKSRQRKGVRKVREHDIERRLCEMDDCGILDPEEKWAKDEKVGRLCDEVRGLRMRYDNYADTLVSKAVKKRLGEYQEAIDEKRAQIKAIVRLPIAPEPQQAAPNTAPETAQSDEVAVNEL